MIRRPAAEQLARELMEPFLSIVDIAEVVPLIATLIEKSVEIDENLQDIERLNQAVKQ